MSSTPNSPKVFDDYEVNCNDCGHYWDDTCDGVPINKKRNCTSFKATKTTDIPKQLKRLERNTRLNRILIIVLIILRLTEVVV